MNTVSNAGAGMSFSNAQQGTRGLSAGDWVRLQRLRGARANAYDYTEGNVSVKGVLTTNVDIAPPQMIQQPIHNTNAAIKVYPVVGTSKIRRPASNWTDYVASQTADYVLSSQAGLNQTSVVNKQTKLCSCATPITLSTKVGICTKCNQTTHVRIM
jgi:hypothetical protein